MATTPNPVSTAIAQRSAARFGRPRETVAREVQLMLEDRQDHADRLKAKADEQSEKASTRTNRGTAPSDHQNETIATDETV